MLCVYDSEHHGNDIYYVSTVMYQESNTKYIVEQASNDNVCYKHRYWLL